jgi:hypothetical protein
MMNFTQNGGSVQNGFGPIQKTQGNQQRRRQQGKTLRNRCGVAPAQGRPPTPSASQSEQAHAHTKEADRQSG